CARAGPRGSASQPRQSARDGRRSRRRAGVLCARAARESPFCRSAFRARQPRVAAWRRGSGAALLSQRGRGRSPAREDRARARPLQGKDIEAAKLAYRRALALQPDDARALLDLATLLRETGERAEALACCERAIGLSPDSAEAHVKLGMLYYDVEETARAIAA